MPKFLTVGDYSPEDYTKADYMLYLSLKDREKGQRNVTLISQAQVISSVKSGLNDSSSKLFEFHMNELRLCQSTPNDRELNRYIEDLKALWSTNQFDALLKKLKPYASGQESKWGPFFSAKNRALLEAMTLVKNHESGEGNRDPEEFSPKSKSLSNLNTALVYLRAWSQDQKRAHTANENLVNDPQFEHYCEQEFLYNGPIMSADQLLPSAKVPPENARFLLRVYRSPAFQHWLIQLILLAVVLTAALVTTAFTVNATLLPLAVAGVVKGFSGMAAKAVLGSAIVIGTGFGVALNASLHARFFLARGDDETSGPPAVGRMNPANGVM